MLWPLALLAVAEIHNVLNIDEEGEIPLEKFSGVKSDVGIKKFHTLTPYSSTETEKSLSGTQGPEPKFILGNTLYMLTQWL